MERTQISFDIEAVPLNIRQYINAATMYDSSCSENAKTFFVQGADKAFLKISKKGSLEREYIMTKFLNSHNVAPKIIAYESDADNDYLISEAVTGEDGTSGAHIEFHLRLRAFHILILIGILACFLALDMVIYVPNYFIMAEMMVFFIVYAKLPA